MVPWLAAHCQDGLELLEGQSKGVRRRRLVQKTSGGVPSNPNYFWCRNDDIQSLSLSLLFIYFKIFCSKGFSHRIKNDIAQALHHPLQRLIRTFTVATRLLIPFSNSSVHVLLHKLYTSNLLSGPLLLNSLLILVSLSVDLL